MNEQHEVNPEDTTELDELNLSVELEKARAEAASARDMALRAQAELENFRKRMRREMEEDRRYAEQSLLTDLLPVIDNIGRATTAAESTKDVTSLLSGVRMVEQQLESILQKHHAQRIVAADAEFDPHLHQAISMQPRHDLPPGSVVLVAAAAVLVAGPWTDQATELAGWDVARFQQMADEPGRPYADHEVEYPPGSVVLVAQEGYQLHDRVLRPSQVIVSTASPSAG